MNDRAARRPRRCRAGVPAAVLAACGAAITADAQETSPLIQPPPVETDAPATAADGPESGAPEAAAGAPGSGASATAARIATPAPERSLPMEEVIVVSESEWRLPDLGSEWRRAQAETPDDDRIELSFLPLYDPENQDPVQDLFERNSALHRMQMIEVIRLRFGGRPQD